MNKVGTKKIRRHGHRVYLNTLRRLRRTLFQLRNFVTSFDFCESMCYTRILLRLLCHAPGGASRRQTTDSTSMVLYSVTTVKVIVPQI